MPFDLENKITWKELAPSLQSLFKTLQQQITKNANDIEDLNNRLDDLTDRVTTAENNIKYLFSISQNTAITGEQDGFPILITTINMEDGKQLIEECFAVRHDTLKRNEGGRTPEGSFLVTFPQPVDKVIGIQMNDTWYSRSADGGRGIGYIDGDNWINSSTMTGSGCYVSYDSVHEVNDPHTFVFFFTLYGYKLTGEVPELPGTGGNIPGEGVGGGDTTDDKIDSIQDQIDKLLNNIPIGTVRYAYVIPDGWLEMNGQLVSRTEYSDLFSFANDNGLLVSESKWSNNNQGKFSYGDGSTNFRVPDFRGKFIRSLDSGANIDPGRVIGTYQMDSQIKTGSTIDNLVNTLNQTVAIRGNNQVNGAENWVSSLPTFAASWEYFQKNEGNRHAYYRNAFAQIPGTRSSDIETREGNERTIIDGPEVRPLNISLRVIIKAKNIE